MFSYLLHDKYFSGQITGNEIHWMTSSKHAAGGVASTGSQQKNMVNRRKVHLFILLSVSL